MPPLEYADFKDVSLAVLMNVGIGTPVMPIVVLALSNLTLVRLVQLSKARYPMLVTLFGIVMLVRLAQYGKAAAPMLVTPLGIVTLVRLLQLLKAPAPMLVTPLGIVNVLFVFSAGYVCKRVLSMLYNTPSCKLYALLPALTFIVVRLVVPAKAPSSILVTLFGMYTLPQK